MTKKHFKAIAEAFKFGRPAKHWDPNKRTQWNMDVKAMADVCASFNGAFDRDRFIAACGGLFYV
jgi:lipopolysaccharide biosynthesis protein